MDCTCNNSTVHNSSDDAYISSEHAINVCGKPTYNATPVNAGCSCRPVECPEHHVVYTDRVFDKDLNAWLSDINKNLSNGNGGGENALQVLVFTEEGNIIINGDRYCTLVALVWNGREDITDQISEYYFSWTRISNNSALDALWNNKHLHIGPKIKVSVNDIKKRSLFQCFFNFEQYFKK